ncbi:DUF1972 domain-containing protein [Aeromicrobium sp. Root472D3]|uniref:DUF1972 domain-containing protein n=1 Tax=Aeromicrobium sp. Root472D3 TaxID=1736540 RepID=UPI0009EB79ED|nr:DUF1972 domain-containing protein [Aeromicrobium sp. Root472D3]
MTRQHGKAAPRSVAIVGTRGYPSYYGGFETAVRRLAPFLADNNWNVVVYGRPGATRNDDPSTHPSVQTVETRGISSNSLSTLSFGLTSVIHAVRHKPDVTLVMNVANGFWLPLLKLRGIRTVVNVDGIEWHRAKWGRLAKAVFRWGARLTAKHADHLVFDARAIQDFWLREFGRDGTFIPYGGDPVPDLPVESGLSSGKYVLMVARFVPENTVSEFFKASVGLAESGIDVVIVGSSGSDGGPLDDQARELDAAFPTIHWLGHLSDDQRLFSLWQHAGAYFHGHSVGGTNPALVQAMAAGAPVVARDTVYNREVLGDTGIFCEPSANDIARSIRDMLDNPGDASVKAVERSRLHYGWDGVCADYETLLKSDALS